MDATDQAVNVMTAELASLTEEQLGQRLAARKEAFVRGREIVTAYRNADEIDDATAEGFLALIGALEPPQVFRGPLTPATVALWDDGVAAMRSTAVTEYKAGRVCCYWSVNEFFDAIGVPRLTDAESERDPAEFSEREPQIAAD